MIDFKETWYVLTEEMGFELIHSSTNACFKFDPQQHNQLLYLMFHQKGSDKPPNSQNFNQLSQPLLYLMKINDGTQFCSWYIHFEQLVIVDHWRLLCGFDFSIISKFFASTTVISSCNIVAFKRVVQHFTNDVTIVSVNGSVLSGTKPLPDPMLTLFYVDVRCYRATIG